VTEVEESALASSISRCPSRDLIDQLGDKWSLALLAALDRPRRFSELQHAVPGISPKVLTSVLRTLERNGFLERRVLATSPVSVEYELAELGRSLQAPVRALLSWTDDHLDDVERARADFDARN
jgi:DNA-binding HxlR family transcriptional regulator